MTPNIFLGLGIACLVFAVLLAAAAIMVGRDSEEGRR